MPMKWSTLPTVHRYPTSQHPSSARYSLLTSSDGLEAAEMPPSLAELCCCIFKSLLPTRKRWVCKMLLFLNLSSIICFSVYYKIATANYFRIMHQDDQHHLATHFQLKRCNYPKLEPFSEEVLPHVSKPARVNCVHSANAGGEILFIQERGKRVLKRVADVDGQCCYRPFHRLDDDESEVEYHCEKITQKITVIPAEHEFIEVVCVGGREDYKDGFAFVNIKPDVEEWLENMDFVSSTNGKSAEERINVILLGFDATSRMNFLRTMPKSNAYLLKNLSAIVMEGYTKVAENTLPNVIPVLSGHTLGEFKRKCMDLGADSGSVHVDECPFIWKRFSTNGFRTGFAEDDVGIGIFNMNWRHAFEKPPTDYYLRPFSNLMQAKQSSGDGQCYGTRLSFKVLLDNLENTAVTLKNHPFFHFTWATKLSHNNPNHLALGDIPLLRFLRFMHRDGHLNRTVLVLMSDHGSRLDGIRSTSQGKVEDRMPLFYLVPPPWFATRFPTAYQNLKANSDKLTSAFDLHETLLDLMDLSRLDNLEGRDVNADEISSRQRKASSLFQPISHNRTCLRAGIPLHWCVCRGDSVQRPMVDVESEEVQSAVRYAVDTMNYHLRWQHSCATLTLQKTTDAFYIDFESKEKLGSADEKPADGDTDKFTILRLSFTTLPGEGAFEASLVRGVVKGSWLLAEKVVRTNEYGDQSHCVDQDFKEFCYCT